MRLANKMKMLTAMTAAALLALSGCGSSGGASGGSSNSVASSGDGMVIGALLPLTGTLAYLAPPEVAAIKLAISDINKAGGVLGKDVTEVEADTSDGEHADQNTSAAQSVLSKHPSVVIGPAASGVVKNVYKSIVAEKIPVISMASTSMTLSGMDPYFFRTVAPDAVQGAVMGTIWARLMQNTYGRAAVAGVAAVLALTLWRSGALQQIIQYGAGRENVLETDQSQLWEPGRNDPAPENTPQYRPIEDDRPQAAPEQLGRPVETKQDRRYAGEGSSLLHKLLTDVTDKIAGNTPNTEK